MLSVFYNFASTVVAIRAVSMLKAVEIRTKAAMPCQQLTGVEINVAMATLYPRTNVLYEACPATINRVKPSCLPLHYRVFPLNSVCRNAAASLRCQKIQGDHPSYDQSCHF
ncbi:hypothetical protein ACLKA6_003663 [Drosophila palustris]